MEDKQLNLNQPLLSVRRGSFTNPPSEVINRRKISSFSSNLPPLPFYKRDLKSGPVVNPGVVPFQWERTPGNPKNESKKEQRVTPEKLHFAPRLPPGRVANYNKQNSTNKVMKDSPGSSSRSHASSQEYSSVDSANDNVSSSEDENVTYMDAQSESFFLDCSQSGVSGLDSANVKPSFPDPQTRDFMMGRFLPAAKAAASGTPQFASKKHAVVREEPKLIEPLKKGVKSQGSSIYYDVHNISVRNIYGERDQEDEEKEDEYEGHEEFSSKFCGLLPKFCVLSPIPGLRGHAQVIPQVQSARMKPAFRGASIENENMDRTGNHRSEVKNIIGRNGYPNKLSSNVDFGRKCQTDLQKKGFTRFKELMEEHYAAKGISSESNPITKRTLYIDSEQRVSESRNSNSSSSESRGRTPSVDSSILQEVHSHFNTDEKATFQHKSLAVALPLPKSPSVDSSLQEVHSHFNTDEKATFQHKSLAVALPLPKSPSESWLSRTLPMVLSKNPNSKTYLGNSGFKRGSHTSAELALISDG